MYNMPMHIATYMRIMCALRLHPANKTPARYEMQYMPPMREGSGGCIGTGTVRGGFVNYYPLTGRGTPPNALDQLVSAFTQPHIAGGS